MKHYIKKSILESSKAIEGSLILSDEIERLVKKIVHCINKGNKLILFGNGGSAADAQHIAAEFIGRFQKKRKSFPAISLTSDSSVITALANDYSYDFIFSRQCESLVSRGDVVIGISTSGNSENVRRGLMTAKKKGAITVGLLGNDGGKIGNLVDISIIVPLSSTPRIQEVHRTISHIICDLTEKKLVKKKKGK